MVQMQATVTVSRWGDSMPGAHVLDNCISFCNKAKGIDSNSCPDIKI